MSTQMLTELTIIYSNIYIHFVVTSLEPLLIRMKYSINEIFIELFPDRESCVYRARDGHDGLVGQNAPAT